MVKVLCSKCDAKGCYNCIKAKEKANKQIVKNWICDDCKPESEKKPNL